MHSLIDDCFISFGYGNIECDMCHEECPKTVKKYARRHCFWLMIFAC